MIPPDKVRVLRARSLPTRKPFDVAVAWSILHYLCIVLAGTAMVCFVSDSTPMASNLIVAGLFFSAATWLIAFFKRRAAHCPLCKGTPLVNSGALTHKKAIRILPLNHGVTATFSIIFTQKFRCMYCGSDYDLLKPPSHLLIGGKAPDGNV